MSTANDTSDRLEAGRAIYLGEDRCARCHNPLPVTWFSTNAWTDRILPRMAKKAKLTSQEYEDVQGYVLSARRQGEPVDASGTFNLRAEGPVANSRQDA